MSLLPQHKVEQSCRCSLRSNGPTRFKLSQSSNESHTSSRVGREALSASKRPRKFIAYRYDRSKTSAFRSTLTDHEDHQSGTEDNPPTLPTSSSPSLLTLPALESSDIGRLNQLPIKCTPAVQRSVQYYTDVYAKFIQQRPQFAGHGTDWGLLKDIIPFTFSDPMVLSSTVALMELIQSKGKGSASGLSKPVVRHATNTIHMLQTALASSRDATGDNVLIAILNLAAMEFHEGNYGRMTIHMQALTRIVELKGGVDKLGFDGYLRYSVLAYYQLWAQFRASQAEPRKIMITYPTHPFSAELCKQISDLPDGFHEPILDLQLCSQVIAALHMALTSPTAPQPDKATSAPLQNTSRTTNRAGYLCSNLLRVADLSVFERLVCLGIIACVIHFDDSKIMYRIFKPFLQVKSQALLSEATLLEIQAPSQQRLWVWAACLLVAQTQSGSWTSRLGHEVLERVAGKTSWTERIDICRALFWDERCQDEMRLKIGSMKLGESVDVIVID